MSAPEIQISKDGLKLSYQRYMADSAAGFVVILGAVFAITKGIPLPLLGHSLEGIIKLSSQAQLFVCLISFLLATPIGLFVNGISWFLLGWCRCPLINFWFSLPEKWYNLLFPTKTAIYFKKLVIFFHLDENDTRLGAKINDLSEIFGDYLTLFFQEKVRMEHVTGLARFTRNLACLFTLSIPLYLYMACCFHDSVYGTADMCRDMSLLFFLSIICIFFCSLIESYSCLKNLSTVYILCISRGVSNDDNPSAPEELMREIHAVYFQDKNGEQTENQPIT